MYTKEEIIAKAKEIHGNKYDYSKVVWKGVKEDVIVICPEHGEFVTNFDRHINSKSKCPACSKVKRYNTEEWIEEAKKKHGDKYDYSKSVYRNAQEKITVICHEKDDLGEEHGEFYIRAGNHIAGTGCPKCGKRYKMTQDEFIKRAKLVHGEKYDYSKTKYTYSTEKVDIVCPKHGVFTQNASSHLLGCGCPKCKNGVRLSNDTFIERAREVHGDWYDYSKVDYKHAKSEVVIGCPRHGYFLQTPTIHLRGCGCQKCKSSKLEENVIDVLKKNGVDYVFQSKILNMGNKTVDFYIPEKGIAIECQGEQHYNPVKFRIGVTDDEAEKMLAERKSIDVEKYDKASSLGIDMVYYTDPSQFNKKNTSVHGGFYKDKNVFTDVTEMMTYILSSSPDNSCDYNIYGVLNKWLGYTGVSGESDLKINEYLVKVVKLSKKNENVVKEIRNGIVKRNYKPLIVFEDELVGQRELVLDKIRHITKTDAGIKEKIDGRKTEIREVTFKAAKDFLEKNHIQGFATATIHLGAFYKDELIGVMSFLCEGESKWNLVRFATDITKNCRGVAGKLFSYFTKEYKFSAIKSFADRRWTPDKNENVYTRLGFKLDGLVHPEYRYYNIREYGCKRFHKFAFRKAKLLKKHPELDPNMTEWEMARSLGYDRIWDCGLYRYVYVHQ